MFLCLINLSNSSFVLILPVPSLSFVGPNIFLSTFLSNTMNLLFISSFKTHVSQAYVTIGGLVPLISQIKRWVPGFHGSDSRTYRMSICTNQKFGNTSFSYGFGNEKVFNIS